MALDFDIDGVTGNIRDGAREGALFNVLLPPCGTSLLHVVVEYPDFGYATVQVNRCSDLEFAGEELAVFGWFEPEAVDAEEFGMTFIECCHAGIGVSAFGDSEVERVFWFGEVVDLELDSVRFGIGELGKETFGLWHLVILCDGGLDVVQRCFGVRIGPAGVAVGDHFSGRGCDEYSLMDSVGVAGKDLRRDSVFPDLLVRVFVVADIVCGYGD